LIPNCDAVIVQKRSVDRAFRLDTETWNMSTNPSAANLGDVPASNKSAPVSARKGARRTRIAILTVALLGLIGTGAYFKWRASRDVENTRTARAALAADGIAVIDTVAEPDETASPFENWGPGTLVRVQPNGRNITDAQLPKITAISEDINLILSFCPITNEGLASLEGRQNIRCIALNGTAVNDQGIKHLRGMNLQLLDLSSTKVTDAGLAALGELDFPRLNQLSLDHTAITDAGLMHLARFKNIEWLTITGTKTTKDGIRHLKAKLPQATVLGG
jgi:hypothetical protein